MSMEICPICHYVPPAQNSFRPNVMSRYVHDVTGEILVLNENAENIEIPNRGKFTREDRVGRPMKQQPQPSVKTAQTLIPVREIPASAIKTPAEQAATPKAALTAAAPVLPTPAISGGSTGDIVVP